MSSEQSGLTGERASTGRMKELTFADSEEGGLVHGTSVSRLAGGLEQAGDRTVGELGGKVAPSGWADSRPMVAGRWLDAGREKEAEKAKRYRRTAGDVEKHDEGTQSDETRQRYRRLQKKRRESRRNRAKT